MPPREKWNPPLRSSTPPVSPRSCSSASSPCAPEKRSTTTAPTCASPTSSQPTTSCAATTAKAGRSKQEDAAGAGSGIHAPWRHKFFLVNLGMEQNLHEHLDGTSHDLKLTRSGGPKYSPSPRYVFRSTPTGHEFYYFLDHRNAFYGGRPCPNEW